MTTSQSYDAEARRDTPLALKLKTALRANRHQPLELMRFMSDCLWDDAHGYYATRQPIGAAGDFITSPEISQTFGELLGLWAAVVWQQMGAPAGVTLAEAGPGRGTLMRDAWRALERVPRFRNAARVHLIESSPALERLQRTALMSVQDRVSWSRFGESLSAPMILIANEFLDCLPIDQAVKTERGWQLRCVGLDADDRLAFTFNPQRRIVDHVDRLFPDAPLGSVHEFVKVAEPLLPEGAHAGPVAALYIDYGHTEPRLGETLQAVRNHRFEHPLTSPGEADLSAHVDFAAVAADAKRKGFIVDGPTTQAEFLGSLGIIERASKLMAANPARANEIEIGVARLMTPQGMGTRFNVLGIRSPHLPPLPGFPTR